MEKKTKTRNNPNADDNQKGTVPRIEIRKLAGIRVVSGKFSYLDRRDSVAFLVIIMIMGGLTNEFLTIK